VLARYAAIALEPQLQVTGWNLFLIKAICRWHGRHDLASSRD